MAIRLSHCPWPLSRSASTAASAKALGGVPAASVISPSKGTGVTENTNDHANAVIAALEEKRCDLHEAPDRCLRLGRRRVQSDP